MTEEIEWRDVKGFEGSYQVSNTGRVRSLDRHNGVRIFKGRELSPHKNNEGYLLVSMRALTKSDIVVNQLVAQAFLPAIAGSRKVRHIDGDRTNNHVNNLERVVRKIKPLKERGRKLNYAKVAEIRASIDKGMNLTQIADSYQVDISMISRIKSNKAWKDNHQNQPKLTPLTPGANR
jgi:NUMOD4 motif